MHESLNLTKFGIPTFLLNQGSSVISATNYKSQAAFLSPHSEATKLECVIYEQDFSYFFRVKVF